MSHEIRTPLTAILGYSEMLLDEDQSQEDIEHEINSIITSGTHLQKIINDILDLSKIEAGQLIIEHKNISPISFANDINAIIGTRAQEKGLSFNIDYQFPLPKEINTDPTRLKQILINLCGNAIKFTDAGHVTVSLSYSQDENQIKIIVSDSGIGISEKEREKLFKPFSQADESTTRIYGGTGLGLCISKQLAQKLGGDISVESEKGKGSQFITLIDVGIDEDQIELITDSDTRETEPENIKLTTAPKLSGHILLVEDNVSNQVLISKYVEKLGPSVDIAGNGEDAINKALKQNYDLILMDMQMPVMDGLEATRQLREMGNNTTIISLTANAMVEDRNKCIDAGANDYLSKPIEIKEFYSTLRKYLDA
jgi:CheY-like chemotaxis protein/anti-sigma regulatory factor (Ser/Thr protein kinase)